MYMFFVHSQHKSKETNEKPHKLHGKSFNCLKSAHTI